MLCRILKIKLIKYQVKVRFHINTIMSDIQQIDTILNEISALKAPGVSGSRIKKLTEIAIKNISAEAEIVNKISNFCKDSQPSHKLGALYIIDSISRGFQNEARKVDNQRINYSNLHDMSIQEGTFLSGLLKLNNNIQSLLEDILSSVDDAAQKEKIRKLVDIWLKAGTFDKDVLQNVRNNYFGGAAGSSNSAQSESKPSALAAAAAGSAPLPSAPAAAAANDPSSILKSLASLAGPAPGTENQQSATPPQHQSPAPPAPAINNPLPFPFPGANGAPSAPGIPGVAGGAPAPDPNAIFQMLQQMQQTQNLPMPNGFSPPAQQQPQQYGQYGQSRRNNDYGSQDSYSQDSYGSYGGRRGRRGGGNGPGGRNRSRSPSRGGHGYHDRMDYNNGGRMDFNDRRGGRQQKVNTAETSLLNPGERNTPGTPHFRVRNVSHDPSLPAGSIKVMSRTLFIGGISNHMDERSLASILRPYAEVQSVILNVPKKHAFVKVYSRDEALNVISSFNRDGQYNLRLRWGVGFGPRDCCDYQHGVSIIPIARLTDADKRWVVSAEWGGTGGAQLVPGIVIDEPDIEIGKGVSSKAISKKMPTDASRNGPKSTKPGEPDDVYTDPLANPVSVIPTISKESNPLANLFGGNPNPAPAPPSASINPNHMPLGQPSQNHQFNNDNGNNNNNGGGNSNAAAVAALLGSIPGLANNPGLSSLLQQSSNNNQQQ